MFRPLFSILSIAVLSALHVLAAENQLQEVTNFGTNPTRTRMFTYRPNGLASRPALIVASHHCQGTAQSFFGSTPFANLADKYKNYMVIYPHAPDSGGCWDVHTTETLTHDKGGDSLGIASMVRYAIKTYNIDSSRVFAYGASSGAMMTQVLAGAYPDLFAAAASWAGVPYGCFAGSGMWNSDCAQGKLSKTAAQWGDSVRNGYPGYTGARPRMQIAHGRTDTTLNYNNYGEALKQWTNVFGLSSNPTSSLSNNPLSNWNRVVYGSSVEGINAPYGHDIPTQGDVVLTWFGLLGGGGGGGGSTTAPPTTTTRSTTSPSTPTTTAGGAQQTQWGQCGGQGYTGPRICVAPFTCKYSNDYYSQCV